MAFFSEVGLLNETANFEAELQWFPFTKSALLRNITFTTIVNEKCLGTQYTCVNRQFDVFFSEIIQENIL